MAGQLKEYKDKVESLQMMKSTDDTKEEYLQQQIAFIESEVEAATRANIFALKQGKHYRMEHRS